MVTAVIQWSATLSIDKLFIDCFDVPASTARKRTFQHAAVSTVSSQTLESRNFLMFTFDLTSR